MVQINSLKQSSMQFSSVKRDRRTHNVNNKYLPLWLVQEEWFSSTSTKERNAQIIACLMSSTDWCSELYFSQHLPLSKTYTLSQKAGKYNPVIFQMGEQERLQKIVSDSAGSDTQGPNHLSDLHQMYSNAREKCIFWRCFAQLLGNLAATQHATVQLPHSHLSLLLVPQVLAALTRQCELQRGVKQFLWQCIDP